MRRAKYRLIQQAAHIPDRKFSNTALPPFPHAPDQVKLRLTVFSKSSTIGFAARRRYDQATSAPVSAGPAIDLAGTLTGVRRQTFRCGCPNSKAAGSVEVFGVDVVATV
jgi:hypothetical protein